MKIASLATPVFSLALWLCGTNCTLSKGLPNGEDHEPGSSDPLPQGLDKSDWHSIRAAHEAWRHEFREVDGVWQARNPGQQWTTRFDGRSFVALRQICLSD